MSTAKKSSRRLRRRGVSLFTTIGRVGFVTVLGRRPRAWLLDGVLATPTAELARGFDVDAEDRLKHFEAF